MKRVRMLALLFAVSFGVGACQTQINPTPTILESVPEPQPVQEATASMPEDAAIDVATLSAFVLAATADAATAAVKTPIPTPTPMLSSCSDTTETCLQVEFDGDDCVYDGPADLDAGEVVIILKNDSSILAVFDILRHVTNATVEEMADFIGPGVYMGAPPTWARSQYALTKPVEAHASLSWERELTPGTHSVLYVGRYHQSLFFCGGFIVHE